MPTHGRTVNRRTGSMTARFRTFSQAPQAVRSAGGRRWDGAFLARARAGRALYADKRDAFGLAIQIHRLRNISSTAATRAEIQSAFSPSGLQALCLMKTRSPSPIYLCYESRTRFKLPHGMETPLPNAVLNHVLNFLSFKEPTKCPRTYCRNMFSK